MNQNLTEDRQEEKVTVIKEEDNVSLVLVCDVAHPRFSCLIWSFMSLRVSLFFGGMFVCMVCVLYCIIFACNQNANMADILTDLFLTALVQGAALKLQSRKRRGFETKT